MTIEDALGVIGEKLKAVLEEDEDAIGWDTENQIKHDIVSQCELEEVFNDEDALENMYTYEMFENDKVSGEKKIEMIQTWISSLEDLAGVEVELDISSIKVK